MKELESVPLDRALEQTGDGAFAIDGCGRIRLWNRAAESIMGFPAREVLRRSCCDVFAARDAYDNRLCHSGCYLRGLVRAREAVRSFDMKTRTKASEAIWLNVSVLPIPSGNSDGAIPVHLFRDVTATKTLLMLVHERLARPAHREGSPPTSVLTRREVDVLRLVSEGLSTKQAAERLHVSPTTLRNHVQHILSRLGVHSRLEAVAYAHRNGLV
jgi:PAS domain S-box-containing protein